MEGGRVQLLLCARQLQDGKRESTAADVCEVAAGCNAGKAQAGRRWKKSQSLMKAAKVGGDVREQRH
jgi:hypothetical protein